MYAIRSYYEPRAVPGRVGRVPRPARSTPVLWGYPASVPSAVHASSDGLCRVLSKGRSRGQETQELTMQNIVILAGNIGQT